MKALVLLVKILIVVRIFTLVLLRYLSKSHLGISWERGTERWFLFLPECWVYLGNLEKPQMTGAQVQIA